MHKTQANKTSNEKFKMVMLSFIALTLCAGVIDFGRAALSHSGVIDLEHNLFHENQS